MRCFRICGPHVFRFFPMVSGGVVMCPYTPEELVSLHRWPQSREISKPVIRPAVNPDRERLTTDNVGRWICPSQW